MQLLVDEDVRRVADVSEGLFRKGQTEKYRAAARRREGEEARPAALETQAAVVEQDFGEVVLGRPPPPVEDRLERIAGSVAEAILKRSPVPVLVVRPFWSYELLPGRTDGEELRPMRNLLLPMDNTDDAGLLLPPVTELARLFEARVVLLHVMKTSGHKPADPLPEYVAHPAP